LRKPIVLLQLQSHVSLCADIVVHGDGNIDPAALGERRRQIEDDEEILERPSKRRFRRRARRG
jgi:hypothetical protein